MKSLPAIFGLVAVVWAGTAMAEIPTGFSLRGSGDVRYLGLIKVYDAALYTPPGVARSEILQETTSRCLKLDYAVSLTVENFIEAAEKILAKQHDPSFLAAIEPELDQLHGNYSDVDENDSYTLCYDGSSRQTRLYLNGDIVTSIGSADFARAYFGIWLGDTEPLSESLRDRLLSGLEEDA